jgi:hypothetical protein
VGISVAYVGIQCRPATGNSDATQGEEDQYVKHPGFPALPTSTPLTYTLTMKACLSQKHTERPTFSQILQLLGDLQKEVSKGTYMDATGRMQVRDTNIMSIIDNIAKFAPIGSAFIAYIVKVADDIAYWLRDSVSELLPIHCAALLQPMR